MTDNDNTIKPVSPAKVLHEIAAAVPEDCRGYMIIIGSLAVGYHYFGDQADMVVRTKDADCLLSPRVEAVPAGVAITEQLLQAGWEIRAEWGWGNPGDESTPDDELPAVRLYPPETSEWFIELLTVPELAAEKGKHWVRLKTEHGHFGLCSFRFLSLTDFKPSKTNMGICVARPEMMALANLLEHPKIQPHTMSAGFHGRQGIKRSNKDLGRVVAISWLATEQDEDALLAWEPDWIEALEDRFPDEWPDLATRAGDGLRNLLGSEQDLDQAYHTVANGLLASKTIEHEEFKVAGLRLLQDAIEPLQKRSASQ